MNWSIPECVVSLETTRKKHNSRNARQQVFFKLGKRIRLRMEWKAVRMRLFDYEIN